MEEIKEVLISSSVAVGGQWSREWCEVSSGLAGVWVQPPWRVHSQRLTWLNLEWGIPSPQDTTGRGCPAKGSGQGRRRGHLCPWCQLHYVYMCLTMKCVLGNVFLIFTYITEECVWEKQTCQNPKENSLALHSIIYTKLSDKFAEGVGMWFCWYFQTQNRSPFPSIWLSLFSKRMKMQAFKTCCQKLAWQNITIPLYI